MKQQNIKKIALIRRNGFGDLVCSVPLIKYIEQHYPEAKITLFVDQRNHDLAHYFFAHLNIQVIPKGNKYWSLLKTALKFRSQRFDLAISIKTSPMKLNNIFLALLGAKHRIAVVDRKSWHSKLINHPRQKDDYQHGHQALNSLRLFDPQITKIDSTLYPKITLPAHAIIPSLSVPSLFVSVSGNASHRSPSIELLANVANNVYKTLPFNVLISYQSQDQDKALSLQQALKMNSQIYLTPSLNDFLHLLNQADVVLAGDGGICHLAASLNKRLVGLYTYPQLTQWSPLSEQTICFQEHENVNAICQNKIQEAITHFLYQAYAQKSAQQDLKNNQLKQQQSAPKQDLAVTL